MSRYDPLVIVLLRPLAVSTFVGVEPDHTNRRPTVLLQIGAGRPEVIKRRFRGDEPQLHQPACGIVDESQQSARRAAVLEPGVLRAVDLHQPMNIASPAAGRSAVVPMIVSRCA